MTLKNTITFAQDSFGTDNGLPPNHPRSHIPPWLEGRNETAIEIGMDDEIEVEGDIGESSRENEPPQSFDALAYYLPFHFYKTGWGIYVRTSGILQLANHLSTRRLGLAALRYAFRILIEHERMHCLAEIAASRIEVISGLSTYRAYFVNRQASEHEEAIDDSKMGCVQRLPE